MSASTPIAVDICHPPEYADVAVPSVVLLYEGSESSELKSERIAARVTEPVMSAFTIVRNHWDAITAAGEAGAVVVVAPASAALGDPDRPMDSAVAGALISFVRSIAIELEKSGGSANTVLFERSPSDRKCQALIDVLIQQPGIATGQEIFVTEVLHLGRLHP